MLDTLLFLIADDHPMVRDALRTALARAFPGAAIALAGTLAEVEAALDRQPETDALLLEMSERYLPPEKVPAYIEFVTAELGEQVAIYLRPQRWLTGDMGPGATPPGLDHP